MACRRVVARPRLESIKGCASCTIQADAGRLIGLPAFRQIRQASTSDTAKNRSQIEGVLMVATTSGELNEADDVARLI